jgi:hypothetical protein
MIHLLIDVSSDVLRPFDPLTIKFRKNLTNLALKLITTVFLLLTLVTAHAQSGTNYADCDEVKDPDIKFQMELCSAHPGCKLVMTIQQTCAKAKTFLTNLKEQIGEGVKGFFGFRKEVTSDHVFEASMNATQQSATKDKDWKIRSDELRDRVKKADVKVRLGDTTGGGKSVFVGDVKDGIAVEVGTKFFSDGTIVRGEFRFNNPFGEAEAIVSGGRRIEVWKDGSLNGNNDFSLEANGSKYKGSLFRGVRTGYGVYEYGPSRLEGNFSEGQLNGDGAVYVDGRLYEKGFFTKES